MQARVQGVPRPLSVVVVPCYNEQRRLRSAAFAAFAEQHPDIRLLFVNDGSSDATLALLNGLAAEHPGHMHVLDKQPNAGKAEAVRVGMQHAMTMAEIAYVGFWDADLATPLAAIPRLLERFAIDPGLQMVFGARVRLLGRQIHRKTLRHYLGRIFATVVSQLLQLQIYDTQCGAKLFRATPELAALLAAPFSSRWIFDVELLARFTSLHRGDLAFVRRSIYEYPLEQWTDIAGSKVGPLDFLKASAELFHIYRMYPPGSTGRSAASRGSIR